MKNLTSNSKTGQKRLSMNLFAAACLAFLFQLIAIQTLSAQGNGVTVTVTQVHSLICGSYECCLKIHVDVAAGAKMRSFEISSIDPSGIPTDQPGDCFDLDCAQQTGHQYLSNGAISGHSFNNALGKVHFDFSPIITGKGFFEFILCAKASCAWSGEWSTLTWQANTDVTGRIPFTANETGTDAIGTSGCNDNVPLCPTCDKVQLYNAGVCYEEVCVSRHWPITDIGGTSYKFHIVPGLCKCNRDYVPGCPWPRDVIIDPSNSNWIAGTPVNNGTPDANGCYPSTDVTVTVRPGDSLDGCGAVCIQIPKCSSAVVHRVTVTDLTHAHSCPQDSAAFKIGATGNIVPNWEPNGSNFPNPLSQSNQFKTTIPFDLATEGDAKIMVFDESGKVIFNEIQNFAGSGRHFFFFTGERLPAGKYFYKIESPLGVTIMSKSLLIVK